MSALPVSASRARSFFEEYLFRETGGREHVTLLFSDTELPRPLLDGLSSVAGTRLIHVDARQTRSQVDVLERYWDPGRRYISVQDYCTSTFYPPDAAAVHFAKVGQGIDYTSFEFPRFDLDGEKLDLLLARFLGGAPRLERARADAFYACLGDDPAYSIEIRSGPAPTRVLVVRGPAPWMELCGPLAEGDVRFAPGSELFYAGRAVSGVLHCDGALNVLPLRSDHVDEATCRDLLALGARIPLDPLDLHFRDGRLVEIRSTGSLGAEFAARLDADEAFSHVVEVGIGMAPAAGPLIREWAAPTNEAVPGIHVGLGADPSAPTRFETRVHFDFVAPDVQIKVNGRLFFDRGAFVA